MRWHHKNTAIKYVGLVCLMGVFIHPGFAQGNRKYTFTKTLKVSEALAIASEMDLGIWANTTGGKIEVRVFNEPDYLHENTSDGLIYGAYSENRTSFGYVADSWITDGSPWLCNSWIAFWCDIANYQYESTEYRRFMPPLLTRISSPGIFERYWMAKELTVKIEITLTGQVTIGDITKINIPGVSTLYTQDFVKQGYADTHYCNGSSNAYCDQLSSIRTIPDLNATDMVVQAHRGVWGKRETCNENSLCAMQAAKAAGVFLLESDIMPYGVSNYATPGSPNFAVPDGLVCFHDYFLARYTDYTGTDYVFTKSRSELSSVKLNKPRDIAVSTQNLLFYDELLTYVKDNDMFLCVDMKNLESYGYNSSTGNCSAYQDLCHFHEAANKEASLMQNLKKGIELAHSVGALKNIAIKTYESYHDIKSKLLAAGLDESLFDQILWAPMFAPNAKWEIGNGDSNYDPAKIQRWLGGWFEHNEVVLYYETNFFNDYDGKSSILLDNNFCYENDQGSHCVTAMEYIQKVTGRRSGIFSEEPVGSKGVVNRWGTWKMKEPFPDRRGDHLWLLSKPYMKHAVITTDRPDVWKQLND